MNEVIQALAEEAGLLGPTSRVGNAHEAIQTFINLLIEEMTSICDDEKADYIKHKKNAWNLEEKEIYAEGAACCDTIKNRMKRAFTS